MSSNPEAQCPDLTVIQELHNSFKRWDVKMVYPMSGGYSQHLVCYFCDLLLQQQLLCMDDAILVIYSYFRGFGEENGWF